MTIILYLKTAFAPSDCILCRNGGAKSACCAMLFAVKNGAYFLVPIFNVFTVVLIVLAGETSNFLIKNGPHPSANPFSWFPAVSELFAFFDYLLAVVFS